MDDKGRRARNALLLVFIIHESEVKSKGRSSVVVFIFVQRGTRGGGAERRKATHRCRPRGSGLQRWVATRNVVNKVDKSVRSESIQKVFRRVDKLASSEYIQKREVTK